MINNRDHQWMSERNIVGGKSLIEFTRAMIRARMNKVCLCTDEELIEAIKILRKMDVTIDLEMKEEEQDTGINNEVLQGMPFIAPRRRDYINEPIQDEEIMVDSVPRGYPIRMVYNMGELVEATYGYKNSLLDINVLNVSKEIEEISEYDIVEIRGFVECSNYKIIADINSYEGELDVVTDRLIGLGLESLEEEYDKLDELGFATTAYRVCEGEYEEIKECTKALCADYDELGVRLRINDNHKFIQAGIEAGEYMGEQILNGVCYYAVVESIEMEMVGNKWVPVINTEGQGRVRLKDFGEIVDRKIVIGREIQILECLNGENKIYA